MWNGATKYIAWVALGLKPALKKSLALALKKSPASKPAASAALAAALKFLASTKAFAFGAKNSALASAIT